MAIFPPERHSAADGPFHQLFLSPATSRSFPDLDAVTGATRPIVDRTQRHVNRIAPTISAATGQGGGKCLMKGLQRSEGKSKRPAPEGVRAAEDLGAGR